MKKRDQYFIAKCVAGGITLNTRKTLINSKLRDMASKAPPPLIRSTKAFSVEIPEGSNSAKSRRSDVVPGDELMPNSKSNQFHGAELNLDLPLGVHDDTSGLHGDGFAEDQPSHHNLQNVDDHQPDANLAKLPGDAHGPSATGPTIHSEGLKDRFAGGEDGHALSNQGLMQARDALHDNLQGVAQDSLKDNLQGISQDALHDNLQGVAQDSLKDNLQGISQDALHDNLQGVAQDSLKDNLQGISKDDLDNHQHGVAKEHLDNHEAGVGKDAIQDNKAGVGKEAIQNNKAGIGKDALHDNDAGIPKDALNDNDAGISKDALNDNDAGIPKDNIQDNKAGIGKEHLEDHIVALPDSGGLKSGPAGQAPLTNSSNHAQPSAETGTSIGKNSKKANAHLKKTAEEMTHEAEVLLQAKIEKEKKLEEFHGRVEAIRKTVSGINHKLDELDDEEPAKP